MTLSWLGQIKLPGRRCGVAARIGNFGDHFLDDGLPERAEIVGLDHETAGAANDVVMVVFGETTGRVGVLGIPGQRRRAENRQTVDRDAKGERVVPRLSNVRLALLVPSPETSMVRRSALNGVRAKLRHRGIDATTD